MLGERRLSTEGRALAKHSPSCSRPPLLPPASPAATPPQRGSRVLLEAVLAWARRGSKPQPAAGCGRMRPDKPAAQWARPIARPLGAGGRPRLPSLQPGGHLSPLTWQRQRVRDHPDLGKRALLEALRAPSAQSSASGYASEILEGACPWGLVEAAPRPPPAPPPQQVPPAALAT